MHERVKVNLKYRIYSYIAYIISFEKNTKIKVKYLTKFKPNSIPEKLHILPLLHHNSRYFEFNEQRKYFVIILDDYKLPKLGKINHILW